MIPASLLTCGSPPPIGIVTKPNPPFWPLAVRSIFKRSSFSFCSTVRTALNDADEGFAPTNSVSSIFSFHLPEKFGTDWVQDATAIVRQTSAAFVSIALSIAQLVPGMTVRRERCRGRLLSVVDRLIHAA